MHVKRGSDRILGATIVASHAGEMISEVTLAIVGKLGLGKLLGNVIHPYPTQAEGIKRAAGAWLRTRATPLVKRALARLDGAAALAFRLLRADGRRSRGRRTCRCSGSSARPSSGSRSASAGRPRRCAASRRSSSASSPRTAKRLAGFAYVLARVANADLEIDAAETAEMERSVRALASLSESEAALVVQIAKTQANVLGDTENYIVTREFRRLATREQRAELLQCVYAVAAADGTISGDERTVIGAIAEELGFTRAEANSLRAEYRDKLSELRSP